MFVSTKIHESEKDSRVRKIEEREKRREKRRGEIGEAYPVLSKTRIFASLNLVIHCSEIHRP